MDASHTPIIVTGEAARRAAEQSAKCNQSTKWSSAYALPLALPLAKHPERAARGVRR
mgnify:CR=1 FL=1